MIEFICLIGGIVIGLNLRHEMSVKEYNKTLEQVDEQVRKDLAYYRNLSDSLKQDVSRLRFNLNEKNKE